MAILREDIKLKAPERLTDNDDGGGNMTGTEIVDGQVNNVFDDISRISRTAGNVSLRKVFAHVDADNKDKYLGGHCILVDAPDDPNVSLVLFNTDSETDERTNAKNRAESYLSPSTPYLFFTLGNQLTGTRFISCFGLVNNYRLPEIGEAIVISSEDFNAQVVNYSQFSRVVEVTVNQDQAWTDGQGTFLYDEIIIEITDPLESDFAGHPQPVRSPNFSNYGTVVRSSVVSAASEYFGIAPFKSAALASDTALSLESIFSQFVPSNTQENALVDQHPDTSFDLVEAGPEFSGDDIIGNTGVGTTITGYASRQIYPGTLSVEGSGTSASDDGRGKLFRDDNGEEVGTVDYESRQISITTWWSGGSASYGTLTYKPAVFVYGNANQSAIYVDEQNRGFNYTLTLKPIPSPRSLRVSYRTQGKWYTLTENGSGELTSDGAGTGSINFATGSALVTLAREPDAGTMVIFDWGQNEAYEQRTGEFEGEIPTQTGTLSSSVVPNTLSVSWLSNGVTKTATDDGNGNLTGDAGGTISYGTGIYSIEPSALPDAGTAFDFTYDQDTEISETPSGTLNGNNVEFTLSTVPVAPGSLSFSSTEAGAWKGASKTVTVKWTDDSLGGLVGRVASSGGGNLVGSLTGTINYSTGEVSFVGQGTSRVTTKQKVLVSQGGYTGYMFGAPPGAPPGVYNPPQYAYQTRSHNTVTQGVSGLTYTQDGAVGVSTTESVAVGDIVFDILRHTVDGIVPGSVRFTFAGRVYFDRAGDLVSQHDTGTDSAVVSGSIDYSLGQVSISDWDSDQGITLSVQSCLTSYGAEETATQLLRTSGSPVRVASIQVNVTDLEGNSYNATSDNDGVISDPTGFVRGSCDYENGIVELFFVEDDNGGSTDQSTWTLGYVDPSQITYNAVVISYLPIDKEIIGVDTTRLPLDGRVPIIQPGYILVIHHEDADTLPAPLSPSQTVALSRAQLAAVRFEDADGVRVPDSFFTVDLGLGEVTTASDLDLTGYVQPLQAFHRIEDMRVCTDAQISGGIAINRGLSRDYPLGSFVSSAVYFGNLQARIADTFTQKVWGNAWADDRVGDDSVAKYDEITYPLIVSNRGAVTERWAIVFTSATTFDVVAETRGVVGQGDTSTDLTILNPLTNQPYFQILSAGWGSGWITNNVFRFNTVSATHPLWMARCVLPGETALQDDSGRIEVRGDAD